jgi:histidyl-tRNA synthetase
MELLQECGKIPNFQGTGVDYVVCAFSPEMYGAAANISWKLRLLGASVDLMPTPKKKVAASFKHADQAGARRMVFVAPDEISKGVVRIKDLRTKNDEGEGIQVDCPLNALDTIDELVKKAASGMS